MTKNGSYLEELCKRVYKEGGNVTELLVKFEPYKAQKNSLLVSAPSLQPPLILQLQNITTTTDSSQNFDTVRNKWIFIKDCPFFTKIILHPLKS